MIHEGDRLDREIKRLERELETPIDSKRRIAVKEAIAELRRKKQAWGRPH